MQLPSPVHHIQNFSNYNTSLYIKRDDLIHHEFGGNKWRKLKYNIQAFKEGNYSHLITFGGPFSNHIAATASACKYYDIPCIGLIRGARLDSLNPTLQKAQSNGMVLVPISKNEYRLKEDSEEVQNVLLSYHNAYLLPEGGTNRLAVLGTEEIAVELNEQISDIDIIVTPIGTGGTAAGIINTSRDDQLVLVINSMKNVELENTLSSMVQANKSNWKIIHDYHFGGFAKTTSDLIQFINNFYNQYHIPLDPVYTGKMLFAVREMLNSGAIESKRNIAIIHTGGLQGVTAYNYMQAKKAEPILIKTA